MTTRFTIPQDVKTQAHAVGKDILNDALDGNLAKIPMSKTEMKSFATSLGFNALRNASGLVSRAMDRTAASIDKRIAPPAPLAPSPTTAFSPPLQRGGGKLRQLKTRELKHIAGAMKLRGRSKMNKVQLAGCIMGACSGN